MEKIFLMNQMFKITRNLFLSTLLFLIVLVVGFFHLLHQWHLQKNIKKHFFQKKAMIESYLSKVKNSKSTKSIDILTSQKEILLNQKKLIFDKFSFQKNEQDFYPQVKTVLDFREILMKKRKEFFMKNIGFQEFQSHFPSISQLEDLKKDLYFIERILRLCHQNRIKQFHRIHRFNVEKQGKSNIKRHRIIFFIDCSSKKLMSFLYDIVALKQAIVVESIRIEPLKESLSVILKLSLFELML